MKERTPMEAIRRRATKAHAHLDSMEEGMILGRKEGWMF
jgi:hypothetical protein